MGDMLVGSLTDDQAILEAPSALVIRVENVYEQDGEYFAISARFFGSRSESGATFYFSSSTPLWLCLEQASSRRSTTVVCEMTYMLLLFSPFFGQLP